MNLIDINQSSKLSIVDDNHFRIQKKMDQLIEQYNNCKNKNAVLIKVKIKKVMGKIIFINQ